MKREVFSDFYIEVTVSTISDCFDLYHFSYQTSHNSGKSKFLSKVFLHIPQMITYLSEVFIMP